MTMEMRVVSTGNGDAFARRTEGAGSAGTRGGNASRTEPADYGGEGGGDADGITRADQRDDANGIAGCTAPATQHENTTDTTDAADWQRAHRELQRIGRARTRLDLEEGHWMLAGLRGGVHWRLGYASFVEYAERLLGHSPRTTREKLRVAAALEKLPETAAAVAEGQLLWSAARELTRVATAENEREWLAATRGQTLRQIERAVSGYRRGSGPGDVRDAAAERHVVRLELSGEAYATLREAMATLRREAGGALDDDAAILQMARVVLGGGASGRGDGDAGRASYQIAIGVCAECGRAEQEARGRQVGLGAAALEMAECDAQRVELGAAHVGRGRRVTQTIPPATRRLVMRRDHGTCQVPGCQHAIFCDVHHIVPRAEGGDHDPDGLLVLCSAHHRAVHTGRLVIEGPVSSGLCFLHADGTPYGSEPDPHQADTAARVFSALRGMGFREREARAVLGEIATAHVGRSASVEVLGEIATAHVGHPAFEQLLREALGRLARRALAPS